MREIQSVITILLTNVLLRNILPFYGGCVKKKRGAQFKHAHPLTDIGRTLSVRPFHE